MTDYTEFIKSKICLDAYHGFDVAASDVNPMLKPHLRPCPLYRGEKGTWLWIKREACVGCAEAKQETQE